MGLRRRSRPELPADAPVAGCSPRPEHLELPRPGRLMLTAGWNLAESLGLPVAGYLLGAELAGRDAGMVMAAATVWLAAAVRWAVTRSVPGLLVISALVLTLQAAAVLATGSMLLFLLQFPLGNLALCVLFGRTAPTRKPLVAQLAGEVVALRYPARHPGLHRFFQGATWLWAGIFAVSTAGLAAALAIEPVKSIPLAHHNCHHRRRGRGHLPVHLVVHPGAAPFRPARPLHPTACDRWRVRLNGRDTACRGVEVDNTRTVSNSKIDQHVADLLDELLAGFDVPQDQGRSRSCIVLARPACIVPPRVKIVNHGDGALPGRR